MSDGTQRKTKANHHQARPRPEMEIGQPLVTVERHLDVRIECECGWPLWTEAEAGTLECVNEGCEWLGQKFARPTITLVRVQPATTFGQLTPE